MGIENAPLDPKENIKRMREILDGRPLTEKEQNALRDAIREVAPERLGAKKNHGPQILSDAAKNERFHKGRTQD